MGWVAWTLIRALVVLNVSLDVGGPADPLGIFDGRFAVWSCTH